jgi:uncharacterized small protein (DUF1192 family)
MGAPFAGLAARHPWWFVALGAVGTVVIGGIVALLSGGLPGCGRDAPAGDPAALQAQHDAALAAEKAALVQRITVLDQRIAALEQEIARLDAVIAADAQERKEVLDALGDADSIDAIDGILYGPR